ncbi:MAG: hypothetical protein IJK40_05565 [Clostridia bacterium]|nr:hypothetical protein [Clostridia bacterium]
MAECVLCRNEGAAYLWNDDGLKQEYLCEGCRRDVDRLFELSKGSDSDAYNRFKCELLEDFGSTPVVNEILRRADSTMYYVQRQTEEKRKVEEKRRIEERKRFEEAEQERKREKIAALKEKGYDGYFEYTTISFRDNDDGGLFVETITSRLNAMALDGWHLVSAYSNELLHKNNPGGVGGYASAVNATVDQHILILERFVKI